MGKGYKVIEHESYEEMIKEAKKTKDGRYRLRLTVISEIVRDPSIGSKNLCALYKVNAGTISAWLKKYNEGGIEALKRYSMGGRSEGNPKWDTEIFQSLFDELDKQEEYWSVPKMQSWIEQNYYVVIPERTIHNHLKKHRYSYKSNRPSPYKGDRDAQGRFKKVD